MNISLKGLKQLIIIGTILTVSFSLFALYRAVQTDPALNQTYNIIYGLQEEGEINEYR